MRTWIYQAIDWSNMIILTNDKQSCVCVYLKSSLSVQILSISMLHECINLKITIDGKLCYLICLYRSPSQNMEEFETPFKKS